MNLLKRGPQFWKEKYSFWDAKISEALVTKNKEAPSPHSGTTDAKDSKTVEAPQITVDLKDNKEVQLLIQQAVAAALLAQKPQAVTDVKTSITRSYVPIIDHASHRRGQSATDLVDSVITMSLDMTFNPGTSLTIYPFGINTVALPHKSYAMMLNIFDGIDGHDDIELKAEMATVLQDKLELYIIKLVTPNGMKTGWRITAHRDLKIAK